MISLFPFWKLWFNLLCLSFAAGADALGSVEPGGGAGPSDTGGATEPTEAGELGDYGADAVEDTGAKPAEDRQTVQEEPEVQEFKGTASARVRALTKEAPELAEIFKKYPQVQAKFEATLRREAALREVFPTVAEARQMREHFPNGLADVQELLGNVQESQALDNDFSTRDQNGEYPGHVKIIGNMFQDDREAAISLFRALPREWARLDPDSYSDVMGKVIAATISNSREFADLQDALQSKDEKRIAEVAAKVFNWGVSYIREKPRPTPEEERLQRERQQFDREKGERAKEEGQRFHQSFVSESRKVQLDCVKSHVAVKRLLANKTISDQKKGEIIEQVRKNVEQLLGKSPSFMSKLRPAYSARNLQETLILQKAAWSQQWLLNRMVRTVFSKEIPSLVASNREAIKRRAGATEGERKPANSGDNKNTPKGPVKIDGRWYRDGGKGAPYTTAEVLAGKHLEA